MTTKSHYQLGIYLVRQNLCQGNPVEQTAFLFGCVEPDMNPATYLKGSWHGERLWGHNYPNRMPYIKKMILNMQESTKDGLMFHYRLGKLVHYLTDAFTYPHNPEFGGTLKDHVRYEILLEQVFLQKLGSSSSVLDSRIWFPKELCGKVSGEHDRYVLEKPGMERDIRFTLELIPSVVRSLCFLRAVSIPVYFNQEVRYENPLNI